MIMTVTVTVTVTAGAAPVYDGTCRDLAEDEVAARLAAGDEYTVRFKAPRGKFVSFVDKVNAADARYS